MGSPFLLLGLGVQGGGHSNSNSKAEPLHSALQMGHSSELRSLPKRTVGIKPASSALKEA